MAKDIKIGLFGFGCVGQGLFDVLNSSRGIKANIEKICVKDKNKARKLPAEHFTYDKNEILNNPDINLVVELIDNADDAFEIVKTALSNGKNVVTANKKMLALHLNELVELQQKYNVSLLYEASSCGSIPIIRNLEEYYDNELLYSVSGIFNGTSNYILTKIFNEGLDYNVALKQAQDAGFAETDPTNDVEGFDAMYKLIIITAHAYGLFIHPSQVFNYGISNLSAFDIKYAKEKEFKIRLVPTVWKIDEATIALLVIPQFIPKGHNLYNVDNEYNGVTVEASFADKQFFYGKGAGGHPTGAAVLSDISAQTYGYRYEYKKNLQHIEINYSTHVELEIYLRYHAEKDLELFQFESIQEKFFNPNFNYVIGTIKLDNLLKIKNQLRDLNVFIASTGQKTGKDSGQKSFSSAKEIATLA